MEALAVGLDETTDIDMISQGPIFIEYMTNELKNLGIPVVTPAGGLGAHLDAERFLPHVPRGGYPGAALAAALYVAGGIRGTERGALSEDRLPDGSEKAPAMELLRLALPRRVFTLSHIKYAVDRIRWLFDNRAMVGGLEFDGEEPKMMRFFTGRLRPLNGWLSALVEKFAEDFGEDN
jgi:tryptophanase